MKKLLITTAMILPVAACVGFGMPERGHITSQGIVLHRDAFPPEVSRIYLYAVPPNTPLELLASQGIGVGSASFDAQNSAIIQPQMPNPRSCLVLMNNAGGLEKIRSGEGPEAVLFSAPMLVRQAEAAATANAAANARQQAESQQQALEQARASLAQNRAWREGACVRPEMQDLPQRPDALSDEQIAFQAVGACVDLTARRMSAKDLYQALMAARMDEYWTVYSKWRANSHESCAMVLTSQVEDWLCRGAGRIFGQEAGWGCIQSKIEACVVKAAQRCRAPLESWDRDVARIKSEPETLYQQCQQSVAAIEQAERSIPSLQMEASLNTEEHQKISAELQSDRTSIPLSQATCSF